MPPEQQNSNIPNPPSPTGSNIPEYLHMEPIADPTIKNKKRKKLAVTAALLVGVILLGSIAFAVIVWLQGEPERKFYRSLDNLMQISYVDRHMAIRSEATGNGYRNSKLIDLDAKSDFSNVLHPQSQYNYQYTKKDEVNGKTKTEQINAEATTANDKFKTRFTEYSPANKSIQTGKWYEVTNSGDIYIYDRPSLVNQVSNILGCVIHAHIADNTRASILDFIRNNKVYTINASRTDTQGDKKYVIYDITIDSKKMDKLGVKLKESRLLDKYTPFQDTLHRKVELWLDDTSELPAKTIDQTKWPAAGVSTVITTQYTYPKTTTIAAID